MDNKYEACMVVVCDNIDFDKFFNLVQPCKAGDVEDFGSVLVYDNDALAEYLDALVSLFNKCEGGYKAYVVDNDGNMYTHCNEVGTELFADYNFSL
jgi:hypothetical protein